MSGEYLRNSLRRRMGASAEAMEERLTEIRHRLVVERACGKAVYGGALVGGFASVPGSSEMEEELLDEAAELERVLLEQALLEQALQRKSNY